MEQLKQQLRSFTNNVRERTLKNVTYKSEKQSNPLVNTIQMNVFDEDDPKFQQNQQDLCQEIFDLRTQIESEDIEIIKMREKVSQQLVDILNDDDSDEDDDKIDLSLVNFTPEDERNQKIKDKFLLEKVPEWVEERAS